MKISDLSTFLQKLPELSSEGCISTFFDTYVNNVNKLLTVKEKKIDTIDPSTRDMIVHTIRQDLVAYALLKTHFQFNRSFTPNLVKIPQELEKLIPKLTSVADRVDDFI